MIRQHRSFVLLTVVLLFAGIFPTMLFGSASQYFRGIARETETWRCSCGAIEIITHPRANTLSTAFLFIAGLWVVWLIVRAAIILTKQERQVSTLKARLVRSFLFQGVPVQVVDSTIPCAMTVGVFRPTILLSRATEETLADAELEAVLSHEVHHARRRDPLLTILVSVVSQVYGPMKIFRQLVERWTVLRELTADQAATKNYQDRRGLAGALLKMSVSGVDAVPAFSPNLIRIDSLLHPERALPSVSWRGWIIGLTVLLSVSLLGVRAGTTWAAEPTQRVLRQCQEIHQMCQRLEVQSLLLYTPRSYSIYGL